MADPMKRWINTCFTPEQHKRIRLAAAEEELSMMDYVRKVVLKSIKWETEDESNRANSRSATSERATESRRNC